MFVIPSFGDVDVGFSPSVQNVQAPYDFMMRGMIGTEEIGLALIEGYHLEVLHMERLCFRFAQACESESLQPELRNHSILQ